MSMLMTDVITFLNSQKGKGQKMAFINHVAEGSTVPFDTLQKIAKGQVKNPRIATIQKILNFMQGQEVEPILLDVIVFLNSISTHGQRLAFLKQVSEGSGVPFDTLHKISKGVVLNPKTLTVQKILDFKNKNPKQ